MVDTQTINLTDFFENKDYNKTFQLLDGTTPVDITGYSFSFKAKLPENDGVALTKVMSIATAASGLFSLNLNPSDTAILSVNRTYKYQIQGSTDTSEEYVYVEGEFEVKNSY